MLFDTDVLIWLLRGHAGAATIFNSAKQRAASVISYMEVLHGARDQQDLKAIQTFLTRQEVSLFPLTEVIGRRASALVEEHVLRTKLDPADAIIAATALEFDLPLCTANQKHYKPIAGLRLQSFRP